MVIKRFQQISRADADIAGGKGASLGEMTRAGVPVPPGFVILADGFNTFLDEANLRHEVRSILDAVDPDVVHTIDAASEKIRALIDGADVPDVLSERIYDAFKELNSPFVAVRSSATSEDSADAAWAGQLESFLNTTSDTLIHNVRKCWSSLFTPRAILYRFEKNLHEAPISVAVVVQKMVNSEKAGVAFSVHPVTQDSNQMIIEAGLGLGEAIVSGSVTPDSYIIEKDSGVILETSIHAQTKAYVRDEGGNNVWKPVGPEGSESVLNNDQIAKLAELVLRIEAHYSFPVDVEWAYESGEFFITQSRPITTLGQKTGGSSPIMWEQMISRNIPPLGWTAGAKYENEGLKIGDVHWKRNRECIVRYETDQTHVFFDANDICETNVLEIITDKNALDKFAAAIDEKIELIDSVFELAPADEAKGVLHIIDMHEKSFGYMLMALDLVTEVGLYLDEKKEVPADVKGALFSPIKQTLIERENAAIRKLATSNDAPPTPALLALEKSFGFIHQDYMGRAWNTDDYERAIAAEKKKSNSPVHQSEQVPSELVQLAEVTQRLVYLYEEGRNAMVKAVAALLESPCLEKLGRDVVLHMTTSELREYVHEPYELDSENILQRKMFFVLYFDCSDIAIFSTKTAVQDVMTRLGISLGNGVEATDRFTGTIANRGIAKGKARLVFTQKDAEAVEDGEIIVSPMTAVEFLTGIRKAAAIVTDEGGVVCHAAIVSREMNIPCVIGTKYATNAISTGDMLYVDANKGVVKVLSQP